MSLRRIFILCLLLMFGAAFSPLFAATPIMVQKDLFSQDRKPPSPQGASTSSLRTGRGMAIGNIQLDGVVFRNNSRKALLRLKNVPIRARGAKGFPVSPFVTVRVGEMVNDYRVTKIDIQHVTLERNGQTYTLGLFSANKIAAPASPAPRAAVVSPHKGRPGRPLSQRAPVKNSGLARRAVFNSRFQPRSPQQALHGRMPIPPNRLPPGYHPPAPVRGPNQR